MLENSLGIHREGSHFHWWTDASFESKLPSGHLNHLICHVLSCQHYPCGATRWPQKQHYRADCWEMADSSYAWEPMGSHEFLIFKDKHCYFVSIGPANAVVASISNVLGFAEGLRHCFACNLNSSIAKYWRCLQRMFFSAWPKPSSDVHCLRVSLDWWRWGSSFGDVRTHSSTILDCLSKCDQVYYD